MLPCTTFFQISRKKLNYKYTCETIFDTLKAMNFADVEDQGFSEIKSQMISMILLTSEQIISL